MSAGTDRRARLWPVRLLELSPLIVFALALSVWLFLTSGMRMAASTMMSPATRAAMQFDMQMTPELFALGILDGEVQVKTGRVDVNSEDPMPVLYSATYVTAQRVLSMSARFVDSAGRIAPFPPALDPALWEPLDAYERATGARVAAYAMEPVAEPRVVLAETLDIGVLSAAQRREYETSGTIQLLRREVRGSGTPRLPVDLTNQGSPTDVTIGDQKVRYSAFQIAGHAYEVYCVYNVALPTSDLDAQTPLDGQSAVDSPTNQRSIRRLAKLVHGSVFVVGPTERLVPLRVPDGMPRETAIALVATDAPSTPAALQDVTRTDSSLAALPGAGAWIGVETAAPLSGVDPPFAPPLLFIAMWDRHPAVPILWERLGSTPARRLEVWLAANSPFVVGLLGACFLLSLVAAPAAFAHERRVTAERTLERARERIRQEARMRVIDRLTELSRRIDDAALDRSAAAHAQIAAAAREIDATVGDLKDILGTLGTTEGDRDV